MLHQCPKWLSCQSASATWCECRQGKKPEWPESLYPKERQRFDEIEQRLAELNKERRKLMNRAKVRKHRERAKADD